MPSILPVKHKFFFRCYFRRLFSKSRFVLSQIYFPNRFSKLFPKIFPFLRFF